MEYKLSYLRVAVKALIIDFTISIVLSIFLITNNFPDYILNKYYFLPLISALATVTLSLGIVYKDRNHGVFDQLLTAIILLIICIFSGIVIILSIIDVKQFSGIIVMKFPLVSVITMFLPDNQILINKKAQNTKKLDPKKKITDDIYYY